MDDYNKLYLAKCIRHLDEALEALRKAKDAACLANAQRLFSDLHKADEPIQAMVGKLVSGAPYGD